MKTSRPRAANERYEDITANALSIYDNAAEAAQHTDDLATLAYLRRIAQHAARIRDLAIEGVQHVTRD